METDIDAVQSCAAQVDKFFKREDISRALKRAENIVSDYGASMRSELSTSSSIIDTRRLPYPKKLIKLALIVLLHLETDPKQREVLKVGYLRLSDWQEGVGDESVGFDVTKFDLNTHPIELAKQLSDPSGMFERFRKWDAVTTEEMHVLKSELKQWGLW